MRRRNFVRSLLISPITPAALAAGQTSTSGRVPNGSPNNSTPAQQKAGQANGPARQVSRQPTEVPHLDVTEIDLAGQPALHYFTQTQFATLRKLSEVLLPPMKNNPGAIEAGAPEFLDFLISVSPEERQKIYLTGLDGLQIQARETFQKSFSDLDAQQVDTIIRPLLVARAWDQDFPDDPLKSFVAQIHEDLRSATMNSREWAEAAEKSGHHFSRGFRTSGYYWAPIDPISEG